MYSKKITAGKYPVMNYSGRSNRRNRNDNISNSSIPSRGLERSTLFALVIGCVVLLYLTELLISSNSSLENLQSKLLQGPFRKHEIISNFGYRSIYPVPSQPYILLNKQSIMPFLSNDKSSALVVTSKGGDDAQVSWPTILPTLPPKDDIEAYFAATNIYPDEKYIALMPGRKTGIRQDRRVVFEKDFVFEPYTRPYGQPSNIMGHPRSLIAAEIVLRKHPLHGLVESLKSKQEKRISLEDTMEYIQLSNRCMNKPIFLSMATVGDDLYWQLIENFVYTMVKYEVSDCSLVICVSDPRCMEMCAASYFPCYEYQSQVLEAALADGKDGKGVTIPSVMEQIAEVKLYHIPKALSKNVSVFMLDLDVGFLADPMLMVKAFQATPRVDIFVQEDMIFVMNRSRAGWKTWTVEPLPNIGLFLCRGNSKTVRVFDIAWERYTKMTDTDSKKEPGKDQNHVLEGMRNSRVKIGLRYAYFDNYTAILLDKYIRLTDPLAELGGIASALPLAEKKSIAVHTTCYEKSTKVMGLKATNAFWNPKYYDPLRRTITKSLLYISDNQLLDEVRSLIWLGLRTNRAVIIPNILGADDMTVKSYYDPNSKSSQKNGLKLWPGFRVVKFKRIDGKNILKVDVLEPGFYWRVNRDYDVPPIPKVILFDSMIDSLEDIRLKLEDTKITDNVSSYPRIVLYSTTAYTSIDTKRKKPMLSYNGNKADNTKSYSESVVDMIKRAIRWANDSVGWYEDGYREEMTRYGILPSVKDIRDAHESVEDTLQGMRTCNKIFVPMKGNRSCFEICD